MIKKSINFSKYTTEYFFKLFKKTKSITPILIEANEVIAEAFIQKKLPELIFLSENFQMFKYEKKKQMQKFLPKYIKEHNYKMIIEYEKAFVNISNQKPYAKDLFYILTAHYALKVYNDNIAAKYLIKKIFDLHYCDSFTIPFEDNKFLQILFTFYKKNFNLLKTLIDSKKLYINYSDFNKLKSMSDSDYKLKNKDLLNIDNFLLREYSVEEKYDLEFYKEVIKNIDNLNKKTHSKNFILKKNMIDDLFEQCDKIISRKKRSEALSHIKHSFSNYRDVYKEAYRRIDDIYIKYNCFDINITPKEELYLFQRVDPYDDKSVIFFDEILDIIVDHKFDELIETKERIELFKKKLILITLSDLFIDLLIDYFIDEYAPNDKYVLQKINDYLKLREQNSNKKDYKTFIID